MLLHQASLVRGRIPSPGAVVVHDMPDPRDHKATTQAEIAKKLAVLKGYTFAGTMTDGPPASESLYHVPGHTLIGLHRARHLGITDEHDLFGGVVPFEFIGTKAIAHPLGEPGAAAPPGWNPAFPEKVRDVTLSGFTAFSVDDALNAGERLLRKGRVRTKLACADGGRGQAMVSDVDELARFIASLDGSDVASGLVLEENLVSERTCSVGRVIVGDLTATYVGTQRLTRDNNGAITYGGSTLFVVRGEFEVLLSLVTSAEARLAISQARIWDAAATDCFDGLIASRRNYDVIQGMDQTGQWRSGVLEQSWRLGGATGAEILALETFRANPALVAVQVTTVEQFGANKPPPDEAFVYFRGEDRNVGYLTKYATVDAYHYA
ncbi:hypothetical protein GCM10007276_30300 [Agaricicola taiwanensis]|uniref:DUF3182 family protein n=1 Tax=Agaricicola taiwanensis TaxID=591372 RepID=A0A8J2YKI8_9RHOB|nr:DUF3182 family protein [Agaricicola taiwanensis]GGE51195.1 hypothetical protein GCM10007276_30300 [Agaricicola taiwanensis]